MPTPPMPPGCFRCCLATASRLLRPEAFDGWLNRIVANAARMSQRHRIRLREVAVARCSRGGSWIRPGDFRRVVTGPTLDRVLYEDAIGRAFDRLPVERRQILHLAPPRGAARQGDRPDPWRSGRDQVAAPSPRAALLSRRWRCSRDRSTPDRRRLAAALRAAFPLRLDPRCARRSSAQAENVPQQRASSLRSSGA